MPLGPVSRRGAISALLLFSIAPRRALHLCGERLAHGGPHPKPRPGIDASKVMAADKLKDSPRVLLAFDEVRQIPQIVDGIRCHCGCAGAPAFYSLLSCFEGEAMARMCDICRGQGRLAFRLHRAGKSLADIRAAIDDRYG
jgi:hypothetical protein